MEKRHVEDVEDDEGETKMTRTIKKANIMQERQKYHETVYRLGAMGL